MIINWLPLIFGLFLGLIPPKLLINSEVRYMRFDAVWNRVVAKQKFKQRRRRWWKLPLIWIDPVRGYVVGLMIADSFKRAPFSGGLQALFPMIATLSVFAMIVWVQTTGREEQGETLSPSSFIAGIMIAVLPPIVALSGILIGFATAVAMTRFIAGYMVAALITGSIGYLFMGRSLWLVGYTGIIALPMLISWMARRSLVLPVRS